MDHVVKSFYDQGEENFNGPEDKMGGEGDRFLEIWNLVFMQYERDTQMEILIHFQNLQ